MLSRRAKLDIGGGEVRGDINVTPLVDVCLVLLIIFMVVTPLLQKGVDVALPETTEPTKMPEHAKELTVSVKVDKTVYLGDKYVPADDLEGRLLEIHDANPDRTVVLKGDKRLKYKDVRKVMRLLNEAGFGRVGLVTEKEDKS